MTDSIAGIAARAMQGRSLDRQDLLNLVALSRRSSHELIHWAGRLRRKHFGSEVRFCSIVAGKLGGCAEDCKWCAQSVHGPLRGRKPRRASSNHIRRAAQQAIQSGCACMGIVNSGRRPNSADLAAILRCVQELRSRGPRIPVCASLGEVTSSQARLLARCGVARYHHNLETSRRYYPRVVTTHSYDDRLATLAAAREAGLSICCGGIFGLGENWNDRVDLALTLRDQVRPDVVPMNFLHPIPGTPLEGRTPPAPMDILRIVAIFRLALPRADIKVAGGRELNLRDLQSWVFEAGATSLMTGDYLTTEGQGSAKDLQMVRDLGLTLVKSLAAGPRG